MKNAVIGILLVATLAMGALYFQQGNKTSEAEGRAAGLQQKIDGLQADLERQQKQTATVRDRLENTREEAASKAGEVAQLQQSLAQSQQARTNRPASQASTNGKDGGPMAELLKSPEMRDMIRKQQRAVLGPMLDKSYADFFSSAHLTPDQAAAVKDLLLKKALTSADTGMSLMGGDVDAAKRTEMVAQMKSDTDAADAQIKQLLGDDSYTQFQTYEKTMPQRTTVSSFNDQLAGGSTPLSADQQQQLIQLMSQDRQNFKFTTDYSDTSKFNGDFSDLFSDDKLNQYQQEAAQLNELYMSHAGSVLSSDQLTAFQKFLASQQALQAASIKIAAKMFNSGK